MPIAGRCALYNKQRPSIHQAVAGGISWADSGLAASMDQLQAGCSSQVAMPLKGNENYYQILGLACDVSAAEIKRAYRRLAISHHPDARTHDADEAAIFSATEEMARINEAYAILRDFTKRAEYDVKIGVRSGLLYAKPIFTSVDEDHERAVFLRAVFHPVRTNLGRVLKAYDRELRDLSADPFDDRLLEAFQEYVDTIEDVLRAGSDSFMQNPTPRTLESAVLRMRQSLSRAADGLEELRYYIGNYDYSHLTMAESLFRIAHDLSKQALGLTKGR